MIADFWFAIEGNGEGATIDCQTCIHLLLVRSHKAISEMLPREEPKASLK